jgi:hypothetical protein
MIDRLKPKDRGDDGGGGGGGGMREGFNLIVVLAIAAASLVAAFITFGLLDSGGQIEDNSRSLTGAIVGFVVAFSAISLAYSRLLQLQLTGMSRSLQDRNSELTREVEELRQQVIRSAERPTGYDIEVLDQHGMVMARPREYQSRGGVIIDVEQRDRLLEEGSEDFDPVPARLFVKYIPAPKKVTPDVYNEAYANRASESSLYELKACERTVVGGDDKATTALRVTTAGISSVTLTKDRLSGELKRHARAIERSRWDDIELLESPNLLPSSSLGDIEHSKVVYVRQRMTTVVCFHQDLSKVFFFGFEDDEYDFVNSVEALNRSLRSVRFLV